MVILFSSDVSKTMLLSIAISKCAAYAGVIMISPFFTIFLVSLDFCMSFPFFVNKVSL